LSISASFYKRFPACHDASTLTCQVISVKYIITVPSGHPFISVLYSALLAHIRILKVFGRSLATDIGGAGMKEWTNHIGALEAKLETFRQKWLHVVPNPAASTFE
jgi:hypothetical protein